MQEGSRKAIVAAFLANLGIAIAKFVGFAITGAAPLYVEPDLYRSEATIDR